MNMIHSDSTTVIEKPAAFQEDSLPEPIIGRTSQTEQMMSCLEPAIRRQKPANTWLYGPAGTGKTATTQSILKTLSEKFSLHALRVDCWEHDSLYSVLDAIIDQLRILRAEQQNTAFKLEKLRKHLGDAPFVIVLDEIDRPTPRDRSSILYCLSTLSNVGLVCIANSQDAYFELDDRIKSRLNPKAIAFTRYSESELRQILLARAEDGLLPGSWSEAALARIARLANGDARLAIQTLRRAGEIVVGEHAKRITPGFVEKAWNNAKEVKQSWLLRNLTQDHRLLYRLIARRKDITSGELWEFYQDHCAANGKDPIALRTFSKYMNELRRAKLINIERARTRGKVRLFKVAQ